MRVKGTTVSEFALKMRCFPALGFMPMLDIMAGFENLWMIIFLKIVLMIFF